MSESTGAKDTASPERKDKKKQKDEKPKGKKTRRHFREKDLQRDQVFQVQEAKPDTDQNEMIQTDSDLSPSAIVEMFHLQDEENSFSTSTVTIARYLVENETSGDFYQVRTKQRKQHSHYPDHVRHRRSLIRAQQKIRDGSTKAENSMCWSILQHDGEKAIVIMILGIVTGMCWMDTLNLHSGNASSSRSKFDSFLCAYSAGSNRSRQNFFILFKYPSHGIVSCDRCHSNCCLVRKLSQMNPHQEYKALGDGAAAQLTSYRLLQAATGLVSTALLVLLIGSRAALRVSRAQRANAKWCEEVAPTSTLFQTGILVLQVCAVLNTTLITTAWLLVALQCSVTMSSSTTNRNRIVQLQEALSEHEKRICELQGTHLEGSSAEDLKSLIQLHQRAIELTEGVLVSKLQLLHRPTVAC